MLAALEGQYARLAIRTDVFIAGAELTWSQRHGALKAMIEYTRA
jgi:hypothetical protein